MNDTIAGTGTLKIGETSFGACRYALTVRGETSGLKSASGTLWADASAIFAAFDAQEGVAIVRDDTGFAMTILVRSTGDGTADIVLSGPPGE